MNRRNLLTLLGATALAPVLPKVSASVSPVKSIWNEVGTYAKSYTMTNYQWFADGEIIPNAVGNTLTLTEDMIGKYLTFGLAPVENNND